MLKAIQLVQSNQETIHWIESYQDNGGPQQIIEKILYQHELFGHQRYLAQIDLGGVPFDKLAKNIELIGTEILPAIRKYTAREGEFYVICNFLHEI